jgi:hypothetical protein
MQACFVCGGHAQSCPKTDKDRDRDTDLNTVMDIDTTQHSTAQHNTAQHSTAQHSTAQLHPILELLIFYCLALTINSTEALV